MGRDSVRFSVSAVLSRHNSEDDEIDNRLWEKLQEEIRDLIDHPEFERISPMIGP